MVDIKENNGRSGREDSEEEPGEKKSGSIGDPLSFKNPQNLHLVHAVGKERRRSHISLRNAWCRLSGMDISTRPLVKRDCQQAQLRLIIRLKNESKFTQTVYLPKTEVS